MGLAAVLVAAGAYGIVQVLLPPLMAEWRAEASVPPESTVTPATTVDPPSTAASPAPRAAAPTTSDTSPQDTTPTVPDQGDEQPTNPSPTNPLATHPLPTHAPQPTPTAPTVTVDPWAAWCEVYTGILRRNGIIEGDRHVTFEEIEPAELGGLATETVSRRDELTTVVPSEASGSMQMVIGQYERMLPWGEQTGWTRHPDPANPDDAVAIPTDEEVDANLALAFHERDRCGVLFS